MTAALRASRHRLGNLRQRSRKEWHLTWRWVHNLGPTLRHLSSKPKLTPAQQAAVTGVRSTGVAISPASSLLAEPAVIDDIRRAVAALDAAQSEAIAAARGTLITGGDGEKTFLYLPLGETPTLDLDSPFARLADQLAPIADTYFGMETQVRAYAVWRNLAADLPAADSQRWHRDREDLQILKAFLYLDDVDPDTGPFWYAPGTHALGAVQSAAPSQAERGVQRTDDDQMATVVPTDRWVECTGPPGTVVLADTHGYHKGGHARRADRLLVMVLFTSADSGVREWFDRSAAQVPTDRARRFRWSRG